MPTRVNRMVGRWVDFQLVATALKHPPQDSGRCMTVGIGGRCCAILRDWRQLTKQPIIFPIFAIFLRALL
jgi:hypothetical protein